MDRHLGWRCATLQSKIIIPMAAEIKDILNNRINIINQSKGIYLTNKIYQIQISLLALEKNYKELEKSLIDYSNPRISSKLWEHGHKERARLYLWNVSRLLQNFLSSAATFRDHVRYLTRQIFRDHVFLDEFKNKIKNTFGDDPLSNFIMIFRNNYLHTCVAATSASFKLDFNNHRIISSILISKKQLLDTYSEWTVKSKDYINTLPDEVPLLVIVKEYYDKVYIFYQWYEQRYFKIFEDEFVELTKLKEDYSQLQKKLFNIKK